MSTMLENFKDVQNYLNGGYCWMKGSLKRKVWDRNLDKHRDCWCLTGAFREVLGIEQYYDLSREEMEQIEAMAKVFVVANGLQEWPVDVYAGSDQYESIIVVLSWNDHLGTNADDVMNAVSKTINYLEGQ